MHARRSSLVPHVAARSSLSSLSSLAMLLSGLAAGCAPSDAEPPRAHSPVQASAKPPVQAPAKPPAKAPAKPPAKAAPAPAKPLSPRPPPRTSYDSMRMHMHHNFDLLRAIERLLIRGELEPAKRFAAAIAESPDAPAHGPWAAHGVLVRNHAAALARATTIDEACAREAQLAAACAGCHVESAVAPEFKAYPAEPADTPTVEGRMLRHRWAADRLWEGMVGGVDEPWRAGLEVLAAPPLEWAKFAPGRVEHARKLRQLAANARRNQHLDLEGRALAYGEMLTTCAACHTAPSKSRP